MRIIYLILLCLLAYSLLHAQVDLEINNGMTVETTGGLSIEVSGDVIENGTGYLKGVVSSGTRSGETAFAGLTLGSGFTGTITRTTGTALSSSSPKTFLRNYELNNTSTVLNTSLSSKFVSSGTNDEHNGIGTPFIYKYASSIWTGYPNNTTTADIASASNVNIPAGVSDFTISEGIGVAAKIFFEGSYQNGGSMTTTIHSSLPTASPYSEDPRTVSAIPANAVDWVLIRLRNSSTPSTVIASHSAFVRNDGIIIDDNGNAYTGVPANPGSFNISIKHRNHLEVMSNTAQSLDWESN